MANSVGGRVRGGPRTGSRRGWGGACPGAYPGRMSAQRNRISPVGGGRRPISPLGPALLAAAAGVVLAGVRRMRARSRRRAETAARARR